MRKPYRRVERLRQAIPIKKLFFYILPSYFADFILSENRGAFRRPLFNTFTVYLLRKFIYVWESGAFRRPKRIVLNTKAIEITGLQMDIAQDGFCPMQASGGFQLVQKPQQDRIYMSFSYGYLY